MGMSLKQIRYLYAIGVFKKDPKASLSKSREMSGTNRQTIREIGKMSTKLKIGETSSTHQLRIGDQSYPLKRDKNGSVYPVIDGKLVGSSQLPEGKMSLERVSSLKATRVTKTSQPKEPEAESPSESTSFVTSSREELAQKLRDSSPLHPSVNPEFREKHFNYEIGRSPDRVLEGMVEAGEYVDKSFEGMSETDRRLEISRRYTLGQKAYSEMIAKTDVLTRTTMKGLESILESGEFRTIHDKVKSSTPVKAKDRKYYEDLIFKDSNPVYGYLGYKGSTPEREQEFLEMYGDVRISLKPSVKSRSTFTSDDSLDGTIGGADPTLVPGALLSPSLANQTRNVISRSLSREPTYPDVWNSGGGMYHEAQIHGGLKVDEIDTIEFLKKAPTKSTLAKLDKLGISYKVRK